MKSLSPIVCNAGFLILRQGLVTAADLLAVRLILRAVGVEGQGICAMALEWVSAFAFCAGTLRAAFQRFLSAELGKANGDVRGAFPASLALALAGGLLVLLVGETAGLWGLTRFLSFPAGRERAVFAVYQLALVGAAAGFLTLPYQALAVARERMGLLAVCGLVESAVLLGVAALLGLLPPSVRLPVCACSGVAVALLSLGCLLWRMRDLPEVWTLPHLGAERSRAILSYFGWSVMSSLANSVRLSGAQALLNRCVGVAFNASWNVAFRGGCFLYVLISSVQQSIEPQLVKRRESGAHEAFLSLTFRSGRWLFALVWAVAFPSFVFAPEIVSAWLGSAQPPQIVEFLRAFLVYFVFVALSAPFHSAIMASVRIGRFQTVLSALCVAGFAATAVVLAMGAPAWGAAACVAAANVLGFVYRALHFCRTERVRFVRFAREALLPVAALVASSILLLNLWYNT